MNLDSLSSIYSSIPTDWIFIGAFAILAALDCLRSGARRICTVALALPITALLMTLLPQTEILAPVLSQFANPFLSSIVFGILFVLVYIFVGRFDLAWGDETGQAVQAALAGTAAVILVVTIWVMTPALSTLWHFGPQVQAIFGAGYQFWWIIASYGILAFVRNS